MKSILLVIVIVIFISQVGLAEDAASATPESAVVAPASDVQVTQKNVSRDYVLYPASGIDYILNKTFSPNSGTSRSDAGYSLSLKGARNFGSIEIGPSFYKSYDEAGTSANSTKAQTFGLFAQYNFVANKVGKNLIPFVSGEILIGEQSVTTSNTEVVTSYSRMYIGAGVEYFPVNDYLSLAVSLVNSERKYDIKNNSNDYAYTSLTLAADFKVYF